MTQIYTNSVDRKVVLEAPVEAQQSTIEVKVFKQGVEIYSPSTVDFDGVSQYSFNLPLIYSRHDNTYEVSWTFVYTEDGQTFEYDNITQLEVVTPILVLSEVSDVIEDDSWTNKELGEIEKAVRYIIQAHTGQFFGKYVGKKSITGSGDTYLRMPMRLISINSLNGDTFWSDSFALRGSGWYLQSKSVGVPTIRADLDGWHESAWAYSGRAPIVAPYSKSVANFIEHAEYEVDGVWGWNAVPAAVKEAARLLINDYACADSNYRDRFLTSMTAADWRIQFHEGAFSNTGNVRANQLLAEFVLRRGWSVI